MIFWFEEDQELQEKYRSLNEERMELVQRLEQDRPGGFQGFVFFCEASGGFHEFLDHLFGVMICSRTG